MDSLPVELLLFVINLLSFEDVMNFSLTCKNFFLVSEDETVWRRFYFKFFPSKHLIESTRKDFLSLVRKCKSQEVKLSDKGISQFPQDVILFSQAERLIFNDNKISSLPSNFSVLCSTLKELWLQRNQLKVIPKVIFTLINLEDLRLQENKITVVPEEISKLTKLKYLYLQYNEIAVKPKKNILPKCLFRMELKGNPCDRWM